ncbi:MULTISPECIES: four helix bundle protein [Niastella]|uniref:Four helix bundle protein n=1 Tax=Niastella soli TaxID=2821487 RepID=A0ABS3YZ95_9BACT|nr:four helix bundle protein [Niastella soli]MBO9202720.1 four helix bundle protein [Niastella soli]
MATFTCFEDIKTWQKARELCSKIYLLSTTTDLAKDYKLRDQINRSSGSVMDNIAEGFGRGGNKEFVQFLEISHGSACECQSQLCRLLDREYISKKEFDELYLLCGQIRGMIISLINYLQKSSFRGIKFLNREMP